MPSIFCKNILSFFEKNEIPIEIIEKLQKNSIQNCGRRSESFLNINSTTVRTAFLINLLTKESYQSLLSLSRAFSKNILPFAPPNICTALPKVLGFKEGGVYKTRILTFITHRVFDNFLIFDFDHFELCNPSFFVYIVLFLFDFRSWTFPTHIFSRKNAKFFFMEFPNGVLDANFKSYINKTMNIMCSPTFYLERSSI